MEMAGTTTAKEVFIKNLNGTSILEIVGIVEYAPLCCLFYFIFHTAFFLDSLKRENWYAFVVENAFLTIPNLLILTVFSDYVWQISIAQLVCCFILGYSTIYYATKTRYSKQKAINSFTETKRLHERKWFISNYRAFMNIATILSILSVDFKVFPRRFAKTEIYGTGFMDIGVGSFIFGHAIISPFARGTMDRTNPSYKSVLLKQFMGCLPILFLGFMRLIFIKATNYHEHVTEYGMHWNFFFTLAFVKFFAGTILYVFHSMVERVVFVVGVVLCLCYQFLLSNCGLKYFIQNGSAGDGSRNNIIDANREGVASSIGYTGLFLIASHLGSMLFIKRTKLDILTQLVKVNIFLWLGTFCCKLWIDSVSRQMANLTYVAWILSLNVYLLICFLAVDMIEDYIVDRLQDARTAFVPNISPRKALSQKGTEKSCVCKGFYSFKEPLLVKAISRNQLLYFLLGNILTGIVNLSINTIQLDNFASMGILVLYIFITNSIVVVLHMKNINTKFW